MDDIVDQVAVSLAQRLQYQPLGEAEPQLAEQLIAWLARQDDILAMLEDDLTDADIERLADLVLREIGAGFPCSDDDFPVEHIHIPT